MTIEKTATRTIMLMILILNESGRMMTQMIRKMTVLSMILVNTFNVCLLLLILI